MYILNGNCNVSSLEFTIAHARKGMPLTFRLSTKDPGQCFSKWVVPPPGDIASISGEVTEQDFL